MSETAINCEHVSKRYRIGQRESYGTLRDTIMNTVRSPFQRLGRARSASLKDEAEQEQHLFWALKDISFEVKSGEVVGIIGRNGAGKSTLLKILSRITRPTGGWIAIHGRVGSLLEVGTGFHPELTGRENIFLNGAILGMSGAEIKRKFDEIVAFAEIEKFIDTPVKRYSSGMYVRLAFAVAAHLEPEILIVDEVLAVGDASFQRKCLNKMEDVGQHGRTVLFVSHNMAAVTRLCQRAILLNEGEVMHDGPAHQVVSTYLTSNHGTTAEREWTDLSSAPGNDVARLRAVRVRAGDGSVAEAVDIRRPVTIEMEYQVLQPGYVLIPNFHCYNEEGICVFILHDLDPAWHRRERPPGKYLSTALIPGNFLSEGSLIVGAALSTHDPVTVHFYERDAVGFQIIDSLEGNSARGDYAGPMPGVVRPLLDWTTQFEPDARHASIRPN
jgi:lipopolysaccharide transport system ATP-binding protein